MDGVDDGRGQLFQSLPVSAERSNRTGSVETLHAVFQQKCLANFSVLEPPALLRGPIPARMRDLPAYCGRYTTLMSEGFPPQLPGERLL